MATFIEDFMQTLGPEVSRQLASNLGLNKKTASQVIPQVAPLILGGLKKQMQEHGGEARVDHILNKYGSADVLNNIGGLFSEGAKSDNPDPRLGGLLGDSGMQAANMISKQFKLDENIAMKIIPMLAPVVLGALTQKRDQGGIGSSGIAALLDSDGDGSILDDVAGFLMGSLSGGGSRKGGALGGLLGGLLGKRR
ncbi:DUF937 domain-containing protein [candidate division KSB1 bacterium]|nr:DUF937 domain-containing protein [candidate division KSB1 bacterium]